MKKVVLITLFFLALGFVIEAAAQGCSQCKLTPQTDLESGGQTARSINHAILYLMTIPYILLAFIFRKQLLSLYRSFKAKKTSTTA